MGGVFFDKDCMVMNDVAGPFFLIDDQSARQVHLGRIAALNISYNGIVRVPVAADCKPSVVAIGSQVEVNIDPVCSHVAT